MAAAILNMAMAVALLFVGANMQGCDSGSCNEDDAIQCENDAIQCEDRCSGIETYSSCLKDSGCWEYEKNGTKVKDVISTLKAACDGDNRPGPAYVDINPFFQQTNNEKLKECSDTYNADALAATTVVDTGNAVVVTAGLGPLCAAVGSYASCLKANSGCEFEVEGLKGKDIIIFMKANVVASCDVPTCD